MVKLYFKFGVIMAFSALFPHNSLAFDIDCANPKTIIEQTICEDENLNSANQEFENLIKSKFAENPSLIGLYNTLVNHKIKKCTQKSCIQKQYENAITWLKEGKYAESHKKNKCKIDVSTEDCTGYIISEYENGNESNEVVITTNDPTYIQSIKINHPDNCVVLFLSSRESTIWDIYTTPKTDLRAVVVGGFKPQMIRGVNKDIKIVNNFHGNKTDNDCQFDRYYGKKDIQTYINNLNIPIKNLTLLDKPIVGDILDDKEYIYNQENYNGKYVEMDLPPNRAGLIKLIKEKKIRPLRASDWDKIEVLNGDGTTRSLNTVSMIPGNGYIVLDNFEKIPNGLYGGLHIVILVPKDLNHPMTSHTHSSSVTINATKEEVLSW